MGTVTSLTPRLQAGEFAEELIDAPSVHDHIVQFYRDEDRLVRVVADFLAAGLRAGEPLIVIATQAHRDAFQQELRGRGFDVEAALSKGQFVLLDARATLETFMVGAMPEWQAFQRNVGSQLEHVASAASNRRVRAYGEMVDLLWRDGHRTAAIHLEGFWNELGKSHSFSLLCAYVMGNFYRDSDRQQFEHVCRTHSHVLPEESYIDAQDPVERLRQVSLLQQRALALETELQDRKVLEQALRLAMEDKTRGEKAMREVQERTASLQTVTEALSGATTPEQVVDVSVQQGVLALGARTGGLWTLSGDGQVAEMVAWHGYPAEALAQFKTLRLDGPNANPVLEAIRRREPVWVPSRSQFKKEFESLEGAVHHQASDYGFACLPLMVEKTCIGGLAFSFEPNRNLRADERALFAVLARQSALALDRARLFQELRSAADAQRKRVEFEQQMVGIVSHDLRNPLHAVGMAASLMLRRGNLDDQQGKTVGRIVSATERAKRLISDFLDFTQARASNGIPIQRRTTNIHELARVALDEVHQANLERGVTVEQRGDGIGQWDADRLTQLIGNLVANAFQHSPSGTPVRLVTDGDAQTVTVAVHNLGPPIRPEDVLRLFEPFQRGREPNAQPNGGVGLGLFISQKIAAAHGGAIEVKSDAETGTTFTVRLPRHGA